MLNGRFCQRRVGMINNRKARGMQRGSIRSDGVGLTGKNTGNVDCRKSNRCKRTDTISVQRLSWPFIGGGGSGDHCIDRQGLRSSVYSRSVDRSGRNAVASVDRDNVGHDSVSSRRLFCNVVGLA